ncbi:hypothetical protein CL176_02655 [Suicoccus acidiformans]|uniref:GntP family permease n=1 Tax=Suicoccus acidiformans TaxID=2036206 RepID=A0A347WIV6_9LACT|nr:GntP family permease [Suicoccus acidiformans]AXY25013.1 hypothetical protein CL176_02655 [Suicoccus acidiformans]
MNIMGALGVLLGVMLIIFLSLKGMHILLAAPLATLAIVLLNQMDIVNTFLDAHTNSFMGALANYILNYFPIFLFGAILARLMEASGATNSIADYIISIIGEDNPYRIMLAIFIISSILTYGGISLFVAMFAVIPLARTLFAKMNISWHLVQIPLWLGICSFTMTIMPGTPAVQNVIPIQYLNTSLTAAVIPSILGTIACITFGLWYMHYALNKSLNKGENFHTYPSKAPEGTSNENSPNFAKSISPLLILILIAFSGSILGNEFLKQNIIYIALIAGILLAVILFYKHLSSKMLTILNEGASASIGPIFSTAAAVAFGSVTMMAPGFEIFSNLITNIPGNPLIGLTILTSLMSGITGSSSGALGIIMPAFADHYLSIGIHPELIHRVATTGSNILTIVPQSGVVLTFLSLTGLTYKNGFKESFITVFGGTLIAQIVIIISGSLLY